eukprot:2052739-Rhodomonas_salina.2
MFYPKSGFKIARRCFFYKSLQKLLSCPTPIPGYSQHPDLDRCESICTRNSTPKYCKGAGLATLDNR